jgi:hypothetical protein
MTAYLNYMANFYTMIAVIGFPIALSFMIDAQRRLK